MVTKSITLSAVVLLAFSGCAAKKEEVQKPKIAEAVKEAGKKVKAKVEVKQKKKTASKISGVAPVIPASEFFKK